MDFFSLESIFFDAASYPISYIEFFGTLAGIIAVWLSAKANIWSWPIGLINILLVTSIFFQVHLYPDMLLQIFFFITNLMGWWRWTHPKPKEQDYHKQLKVSFMPIHLWLYVFLVGGLGTFAIGILAQHIHTWIPFFFNCPSAFPYLDSFVTVMSIVATFMMIHKKIECWILWIGIDLIATGIYFSKGIKFVGIEYIIFSIIALFGLLNWIKTYKFYTKQDT